MFTIEKNVKLPVAPKNSLKGYKYPFRDMVVGDSFLVKVEPQTPLSYVRTLQRVSAMAGYTCGGQYARNFSVRQSRNENGVRVFCLRAL
jgi:hypothetical protein